MTNMPADKVIKGESGTVDEPTEKPTKENWAFGGWINAATNADFVFTNPCTENTIIKAKWVTPKQYTVMFQLTGNCPVSRSQSRITIRSSRRSPPKTER